MKRPEGFDPGARAGQPPQQPAVSKKSDRFRVPKTQPRQQPDARESSAPARSTPPAPALARETQKSPSRETAHSVPAPSAARNHGAARRALRKASRERKRFERGEIKRFTRRSRSRRATIISFLAVVVALGAVLAVAVFSPILALRTIEVRGITRLSEASVREAIKGQIGTPLALINFSQLERELSEFSLIRSYVTETVPPNTLIVHIIERQPVGVLQRGDAFDLVDPAGVVVQSTTQRPDGVPLITISDGATDGAAFESLIDVLLALPPALLAQVDSITATTKDDVTFSLRGGKQSVIWGSVDQSEYKARVLAVLVKTYKPSKVVEFDVSAPDSVVVNSD